MIGLDRIILYIEDILKEEMDDKFRILSKLKDQ